MFAFDTCQTVRYRLRPNKPRFTEYTGVVRGWRQGHTYKVEPTSRTRHALGFVFLFGLIEHATSRTCGKPQRVTP